MRSLEREQAKFLKKSAKAVFTKASSDRWTEWEISTPEEITEANSTGLELTQAFKNNRYIVMVCVGDIIKDIGICARIMIRDNRELPIHSWADFMRIKDELFGEGRGAIEYYPPRDDLVDEKNIYHLWILPRGYNCPFNFGRGDRDATRKI